MALSPLSVFIHHFSRIESQTHEFLGNEEEPYYQQEKIDTARALNDQLQSLSIKCRLLKQQNTDIISDELESISQRILSLQGRLHQRTPLSISMSGYSSALLSTAPSPTPIADMASAVSRPSAFTLLRPIPRAEFQLKKEEHKPLPARSSSVPAMHIREVIQIKDAATACTRLQFKSVQAPRLFHASTMHGLAKTLEHVKMKATCSFDEPEFLKQKKKNSEQQTVDAMVVDAMVVDEVWDTSDHSFIRPSNSLSSVEQIFEQHRVIAEKLEYLLPAQIIELRNTLAYIRYLNGDKMHYMSIVGSVLKDYAATSIHHLNKTLINTLIEQMNGIIEQPMPDVPRSIEEKLAYLKAICPSIKIPSYINILLYEIILSECDTIPNELLLSPLSGEEIIDLFLDQHIYP